jgi:hypothetical protein
MQRHPGRVGIADLHFMAHLPVFAVGIKMID